MGLTVELILGGPLQKEKVMMQRGKVMNLIVGTAMLSSFMITTVTPSMAETNKGKGTVNGALIGGALGALATHGSAKGAVIGAVAGGVIGNATAHDSRQRGNYHHRRRRHVWHR